MHPIRLIPRLAALGLVLMAAGCSLAPRYERQLPPLAPEWTAGAAAPAQQNATLPDWRQLITDEPMRALVETAVANNRDLRAAALRIEKAQAQYRIARADLLPGIDASATGNMQRTPATLSSSGAAVTSHTYSVGLGFSTFELDLFGRVQSLKDQALESFLATEASRRSVELSLVAEVASGYLTLAADREHLTTAREILATEQESYEIIRQRAEFGVAGDLDLKRAQTTVEAARLAVARYEAAVTLDENMLGQLCGRPLEPAMLPARSLAEVKPVLAAPAGLPSEVLTRRPDILAAEHQLKAANASIGAARARFFPSISLTGSFGTASNEIDGLFKSGSQAWSFAPQIILPIFHAGAISAGVSAAEAERGIMLAQYEKSVQTAFREVSDTLAQGSSLRNQETAQASLTEAAAVSYDLATRRYDAGIDGYLSKLDAQRTDASARQDLISVRLARQANLLTLYKVLGGAWDGKD